MYYYVYILLSGKDEKLYIGYTNNLKARLTKHKNGFVQATKNRRPLKLIYAEVYIDISDAKRREKFLKGGKGRNELKIQLQNTFSKVNYLHSN